MLWLGTNLLAASLAMAGIFYYVIIYTYWLKRRSPHNIVIGGGAGAMPVLVGWAAVTGSLAPMAFLLFVIIFYWTPPHFWALALTLQGDYARAKVPMFPVVYGERSTRHQIFLYSVPMVVLTLLPVFTGHLGPFYLLAALVLGVIFLYQAWLLCRRRLNVDVWRLYKYSLLYLALLFVAMVIDHLPQLL